MLALSGSRNRGIHSCHGLRLDRRIRTPDNGIATGLASLPAPAKFSWLMFRTLAAVVTVPLAEELAFR